MATVDVREIVDTVIAGNGWFSDDPDRVVKIVEYNNMFNGAIAWGLIYEGQDLSTYETAVACRNPRVIWQADD